MARHGVCEFKLTKELREMRDGVRSSSSASTEAVLTPDQYKQVVGSMNSARGGAVAAGLEEPGLACPTHIACVLVVAQRTGWEV